ncbi:MAG: GNAT family N-acetyltransferase [Clostridiales bacterium]|nr:GNAT family N-acetyltransferase [Clostridiales bacterium]
MTIRLMDIEDYEQVYDLWISTPGMGLNSIDDTREGIAKYLKRNSSMCFVAEDGQEIVGVILCGHDGRRGMVHHTAVKESLRRRGVGKALWEAAAAALRKEGVTKAWLVVKKQNEPGNAFWEQLGFEDRTDLTFRGATLDTTLVRIDT